MVALWRKRQAYSIPASFDNPAHGTFLGEDAPTSLSNPLYDNANGSAGVYTNPTYNTVTSNPMFSADVGDEPNYDFGYQDVSV